MNAKNLTQCSNVQMFEAVFDFAADSTMAPCKSMRTKTWLFEKTTFPLKFGQNGRGAKARSLSQRRIQPGIKTICNAETWKKIVRSLFDFSKLVYYST